MVLQLFFLPLQVLYKRVVPILFGLITIIGLIGNSMVIVVILRNSHMRTTVNIILLNLAICDVLFVSVCVPFVTYHYVADTWLLGNAICKMFQFFFYTSVYVSAALLVLVSVVRYFTVIYGTVVAKYFTRYNTIILIASIWMLMLTFNCPILLVYRVKTYPMDNDHMQPYSYCGMSSTETGRKISILFFLLTYLIPLFSLASLYMKIFRYLSRKRSQSLSLVSYHNGGHHNRVKDRTQHATRVCFFVVSVFCLSWFPLNLHLLLAYFGIDMSSRAYEIFRIVAHTLAYANSCINPFIYNLASVEFRQSFMNLFFCYTENTKRTEHIYFLKNNNQAADNPEAQRLNCEVNHQEGELADETS